MTRKRKRSSAEGSTSQIFTTRGVRPALTNLPIEVLAPVLSSVIYDHRYIATSRDQKSSAKIYTSPILQVSRVLRQQGLSIIDRRVVWIRVKFHLAMGSRKPQTLPERLPIIPSEFYYLIAPGSPRVSFELGGPEPKARRPSWWRDTRFLILPFTMFRCIEICRELNFCAVRRFSPKLTIKYENMTEYARNQVALFVSPVLTEFLDFRMCNFDPSLDHIELERDSRRSHRDQEWSLTRVRDLAKYTLECADKLELLGYHNEAGLLLVSKHWLTRDIVHLPEPRDWRSRDEIPPYHLFPRWSGMSQEQHAIANELRSLFFQIEHRFCLAYTRLSSTHGLQWCSETEWEARWHDVWLHFGQDPPHGWFGITPADQAQLHYGRGLLSAAIFRLQQIPNESPPGLSPLWELSFEKAAEEMYFASRLQPENELMRSFLAQYLTQLGRDEAAKVERECDESWVTVTVKSIIPDTQDVTWSGNKYMLRSWGGKDVLRYLPLARWTLGDSIKQ